MTRCSKRHWPPFNEDFFSFRNDFLTLFYTQENRSLSCKDPLWFNKWQTSDLDELPRRGSQVGAKLTAHCSAEPIPPSFEPSKAMGSSRLASYKNTSKQEVISRSSWNVMEHLLDLMEYFDFKSLMTLDQGLWIFEMKHLSQCCSITQWSPGLKLEGFFATAASQATGWQRQRTWAAGSRELRGRGSPVREATAYCIMKFQFKPI